MSLARKLFWAISVITVAVAVLTGCGGGPALRGPRADGGVAAGVADASAAAPDSHLQRDRPITTGDLQAAARGYVGLVASRWHAGLVALWDARRLTIGQLDGAWHRFVVPEGYRPVTATFDRFGSLYLLDGQGRMLRVAAGAPPRWRRLPFAGRTQRLEASRQGLVWIGQAQGSFEAPPVRVSLDGGGSWRALRLPEVGNAGAEIGVDLDGGLQLMTGSEAACGGGGQHRELGRLAGGRPLAWRPADWPLDAPYEWLVGPRGWAYAVVREGDGCRPAAAPVWICSVRAASHPLRLPARQRAALVRALTRGGVEGPRASNGRALLLALGDRDGDPVLRIVGDRARMLGPGPRGLSILALDRAGTPLALAAGRPLRWSPDAGWNPVALPSGH